MKLTLNKKIIGTVAAGLFALSVMGIGVGMGIGTVSAHDPIEDHAHPHVEATPVTEPAADSVIMSERMTQAFHDAGWTDPVVNCEAFTGNMGASAEGLLMAESTSRLLGHDWSPMDMKDSAANINVNAGAEAVICAGAAVRHSISGTGFSNN